MTENGKRMTRAELIQWLGNAISTETSKPFEEINHEFVDECSRLLDELLGTSVQMPEDLLAKLTAKLDEADPPPAQKKFGFFKRNLRKIAVAAAVILCMSVTVIAVPALRDIICDVLQMDVGNTINDNGIIYTNKGKGKSYVDMDALISAEELNILSFKDHQNTLKINKVIHMDDVSETVIVFDNPSIGFVIHHGVDTISDEIKNNSEHLTMIYSIVYLLKKETATEIEYEAYFIYNDDIYIIKSPSQESIYSILNSLTN